MKACYRTIAYYEKFDDSFGIGYFVDTAGGFCLVA